MKIQLQKQIIDSISLNDLDQLYNSRNTVYPLGERYHKLYAYISTLYNNVFIADLGTRTGNTALSLSYNEKNIVDSYDIDTNCINAAKEHINRANLSFFAENILCTPKIFRYDIISLDIDPHSGQEEEKLIQYLVDNDWKGIMIMDGIGPMWEGLHKMWTNIKLPKWDVTQYGHESGTGIVDFTGNLKLELV